MRQFFDFLEILNKILIFLSVFITLIIISGLTINIRSTVLKMGLFSLNIFYSINTNDIQHTYIVNIQRIRTKA